MSSLGKLYPPQGFPKGYLALTQNVGSYSNNTNAFWSINSHGNLASTESDRTIAVDFNFVVTRLRFNPGSNGKNADSSASFRDDGVDIGLLTIPAGSAVKVDSGALNVRVVSGSLICFRIDTSASGSGSLQSLPMAMYGRSV